MESEKHGPPLLEQPGRDQSGDRRLGCVVTNGSIEAHAHRGRRSKVAAQKRKERDTERRRDGRSPDRLGNAAGSPAVEQDSTVVHEESLG